MKTAAYGQIAGMGKALASGPRLELLDLLCQGPRSVEALAEQIGQSVANTSHHLQVLRRGRLVDSERHGVQVIYRVASDEIVTLYGMLRKVAESRLHEIEEATTSYLASRGVVDEVDREELATRVERGEVTVVDVRPASEYAAGHIRGALSLPVGDLDERLSELPRDREVVVYCRGPYCVMALDAVEKLRAAGLQATRLDEGVIDWQLRGWPLERTAA